MILINPDNLAENIGKLKELRSSRETNVINENALELITGYTNGSVHELLLAYNALKDDLLKLMDNTIYFMEKTKNEYVRVDDMIADIFTVFDGKK